MFQSLIDSVATSCLTYIGALGLLLVSRSSRVLHFAHGSVLTLTAYAAFFFLHTLGMRFVPTVVLALLVAGILGVAIDSGVYRPIRKRGTGELVGLLASLGVFIVGQEFGALVWGTTIRSIRVWQVQEGWHVASGTITGVQVAIVLLGVGFAVLVYTLRTLSPTVTRIRAVWGNPWLAEAAGLPMEKLRLLGVLSGSTLAGVVGLLVAADIDIFPHMGFAPLMLALSAMIIGGNRIEGVLVGSLVVGFAHNMAVIWLPLRWQNFVVYAILFVVLVAKGGRSSVCARKGSL